MLLLLAGRLRQGRRVPLRPSEAIARWRKCSWGARCRFGCVPQVEKEVPVVTGDLDALAADVLKLCDAQGSILLANLPKSYQTAYKTKINPRDYGHENWRMSCNLLPGLHVETGPRGFVAREGDDVQPPPKTSTEKKPVRVVSEKASPDTLEALSTEILQVIDANEGEVLAAHLPKRYHRTFGKKLIPQDYGCEKLLELLRATPRVGCGSGPRATVTRSAPRAAGGRGRHGLGESHDRHDRGVRPGRARADVHAVGAVVENPLPPGRLKSTGHDPALTWRCHLFLSGRPRRVLRRRRPSHQDHRCLSGERVWEDIQFSRRSAARVGAGRAAGRAGGGSTAPIRARRRRR